MAASAIPNATPPAAPIAAAASANVNTDAVSATSGNTSLDFMKTLTQLLGTDGGSSSGDDATTGTDELSDALLTDPSAVPDMLIADIAQTLGIVAETRSVSTPASETETRSSASVQLQATQSDAATDLLKMVANAAKQEPADTALFDTGMESKGKNDGSEKAGAEGVNALGMQSNATTAPIDQRAQLHIREHVGTAAWREEVGAKLNWLIDRGVQSGSLRLTPDNLGPLEVRISVQNDQVSVWFGAAHADTRAALENALPRLREMFAAQGMSLADAGVFREPPKNSQQGTPQDGARGYGNNVVGIIESGEAMISRVGLLDAYA